MRKIRAPDQGRVLRNKFRHGRFVPPSPEFRQAKTIMVYRGVKGEVRLDALIGAAEAVHHIPGLEALNAFGFAHLTLQIFMLSGGILLYLLMTALSYRKACADFEQIDL